ncbi:Rieske (2Fe-2S) protein [Jeongeupia naejangsanensis]|uniref:Rieske 2Fe-2S domain-containing protein n=1 Tax=Jeongeupia naejangsanensis TaxID=613195 RepID=A0ABS2BMX2_9NEIS|nr:Rieske 2Fe-2S domain-containing protein [Jeongeupia naejangsanensis]MBM3116346.1 Rieske 2Fe-2S domain-containing protein [Jeongeupia naejangsanensis]
MSEQTAAPICRSAELVDGGLGVRFSFERNGGTLSAFVVRHDGKVYAYENACAHIPVELDYRDGEFFDLSRRYLVCATHGAYYAPETGVCLGGPCAGRRLAVIGVVEHDGAVWLQDPDPILKPLN